MDIPVHPRVVAYGSGYSQNTPWNRGRTRKYDVGASRRSRNESDDRTFVLLEAIRAVEREGMEDLAVAEKRKSKRDTFSGAP